MTPGDIWSHADTTMHTRSSCLLELVSAKTTSVVAPSQLQMDVNDEGVRLHETGASKMRKVTTRINFYNALVDTCM